MGPGGKGLTWLGCIVEPELPPLSPRRRRVDAVGKPRSTMANASRGLQTRQRRVREERGKSNCSKPLYRVKFDAGERVCTAINPAAAPGATWRGCFVDPKLRARRILLHVRQGAAAQAIPPLRNLWSASLPATRRSDASVSACLLFEDCAVQSPAPPPLCRGLGFKGPGRRWAPTEGASSTPSNFCFFLASSHRDHTTLVCRSLASPHEHGIRRIESARVAECECRAEPPLPVRAHPPLADCHTFESSRTHEPRSCSLAVSRMQLGRERRRVLRCP